MPEQLFELTTQVMPGQIFYALDYVPRVKNCGAMPGVIYPSGHLHGLDYAAMEAMGSGTRVTMLDELAPSHEGDRPSASIDEANIQHLAFQLFLYRIGLRIAGGIVPAVVLRFNPRTAKAIDALLTPEQREDVKAYGRKIPRFGWQRRRRGFAVFFSSGHQDGIPDENLVALRTYARS